MTVSDWMIVCATLLGPIIAVQVQKAIEAAREARGQKRWVFHQLMATRAAPLSFQHVQALNMIDLAFYGKGPGRRSADSQRVLDQWKEHLDLLSDRELQNRDLDAWVTKLQDSHVDLLVAIAKDVGYSFDRVLLRKGAYNPEAHGVMEYEENHLRRLTIGFLEGKSAISMNVASFPVDEEATNAQTALSTKLGDLIVDGGLNVRLVDPDVPSGQPENAQPHGVVEAKVSPRPPRSKHRPKD